MNKEKKIVTKDAFRLMFGYEYPEPLRYRNRKKKIKNED